MIRVNKKKNKIKPIDNFETEVLEKKSEITKLNLVTHLTELIDLNDWNKVFDVLSSSSEIINKPIINGNTVFHIACIKGQTDFIKKLISNKDKLHLNINIFNPEGLTGAHLYYKYGGNDDFLLDNDMCYVDESNYVLARYLIDKIDLLETLIDKMIKIGCVENVGMRNDNYMFVLLMTKINYYSTVDEKLCDRYVKIVEKLYIELRPRNFVFLIIQTNCISVLKMLFYHEVDFNIYSESNMTPIAKCIDLKRIEMLVLILEYIKLKHGIKALFKSINTSDVNYDFRPIFITIDDNMFIVLQILIDYMKIYVDSEFDSSYVFKYTDSSQNTYLHRLLVTKLSVPKNIMRFFIEHSDLNRENYAGITASHLLFGKGVWKEYKDLLKGREINLLKTDDLGNNCYSYIEDKDKSEFIELTQHLKIPVLIKNSKEVDRMFDIKSVKQILELSKYGNMGKEIGTASIEHIKAKNYGLFNSNLPHYMLYLRYLENKHSSMYVPVQKYDPKLIERDVFFFSMVSSYITSKEQNSIVKNVRLYQQSFYSYIPHNIYWVDEECWYVHPDLVNILKSHDMTDKDRYVMIKLSIVVTDTLLHANVLLYDRQKKEAWRFEPYGTTRVTSKESMDKKLKELLEQVYGKISYREPDDFLSDLNFQMVDGEDYIVSKNLGDPGGYCLAWSIWFIDTVLSHQDKDIEYIMRNFFSRQDISLILSEEEGSQIESKNYYLDFIRRYAHKLDNEKNHLLTSMGIKQYYLYNTIFRDDVFDAIEKMFKVGIEQIDQKDSVETYN